MWPEPVGVLHAATCASPHVAYYEKTQDYDITATILRKLPESPSCLGKPFSGQDGTCWSGRSRLHVSATTQNNREIGVSTQRLCLSLFLSFFFFSFPFSFLPSSLPPSLPSSLSFLSYFLSWSPLLSPFLTCVYTHLYVPLIILIPL